MVDSVPSSSGGLPETPLSAAHGGTGLNTSGSDGTKYVKSNGSGGFVMSTPAGGVSPPLNLQNTTDAVGLSIQGKTSGQTANIFEVRRGSDGYPGLSVDASGLNTQVYNLASTGGLDSGGQMQVRGGINILDAGRIQITGPSKVHTASLSGGTLTVANTSILANSRLLITRISGTAANFGWLTYTISAGVGYTINSTNNLDNSLVTCLIIDEY